MPDIPISAVAGSARLALQVVSQRKRPLLEIYATLRHKARPPEPYTLRDPTGKETQHVMQGADVFVDFVLANIGGVRAENVSLSLDGDYTLFLGHKMLSSLAVFRGAKIPQMAPAQVFPLFHIDSSALESHGADGKSSGMSKERFTIKVQYSPPRSLLGRLKRRKYRMEFSFGADLYDGSLIPPRE